MGERKMRKEMADAYRRVRRRQRYETSAAAPQPASDSVPGSGTTVMFASSSLACTLPPETMPNTSNPSSASVGRKWGNVEKLPAGADRCHGELVVAAAAGVKKIERHRQVCEIVRRPKADISDAGDIDRVESLLQSCSPARQAGTDSATRPQLTGPQAACPSISPLRLAWK